MAILALKRAKLPVVAGALIFTTAQLACGALSNLPPVSLSAVRAWACQLQGMDTPKSFESLEHSRYDLLVVEPVRTDWSSGNKRFDTPGMVRRLQAGQAGDGAHRRLVLAYLDIGEAEDWRWYWSWSKGWKKGKPRSADLPAFIIRPDPDGWAGNYPVAFWDAAWKDILLYGEKTPPAPDRPYRSVLDEVVQSGFDGVYLDWVEAYDDTAVKRAAKQAGVDPARQMIELIGEIRTRGRQHNPSFIVIQQNAAALLEDHPELLRVIDAIAQEDTWYAGIADAPWDDPRSCDQPTKAAQTRETLALLKPYRAAGKPVFTLDYTVRNAAETYRRALAEGFVPYCSRVSLNRLTGTPPPALSPP